jgi:hypothetical protein
MIEKLKALLQTFWAKVKTDTSELWEKDKGFLILFGVVILGVKFREILINLLVSDSKAVFDKAQTQSDVLQKNENEANTKADALVKESDSIATQDNGPIGDDWNTK